MSAPATTRSPAFLDISRDLLTSGYQVKFQADGSSMYPTIRNRETITVASVDPSAIRPGDIALYRCERGVIAHRVRRIERGGDGPPVFRLRGDAADGDDAPVEADQILGLVRFVDRDGRRLAVAGRWARVRQALRIGASRLKGRLGRREHRAGREQPGRAPSGPK